MKEIKIHTDYILLGQFLKFTGSISNGGQAKSFLLENNVKVNGIDENRRGKKLYNGDKIEIFGVLFSVIKEKDE